MLNHSEKSPEKNRFLPPYLQSYGDLFWEARKEWVDLDDENSIKAFLQTKDTTGLYINEYLRNITIPEDGREKLEENFEGICESIKNDFNNIAGESRSLEIPLNEVFFYKYLPTYLPDGEAFQIIRRQKNRNGKQLAAENLRDEKWSSLFYRKDYPNREEYDSKKVTFWYVNDDRDWDYDMRRKYSPWDVLVMSDIVTSYNGVTTHCPMINGFLDWKNNPHLPSLLDWILEFTLQKTSEWNLSYEEIDIQNFKIQHLQKLVVWYEQSLDYAVWKIQECKRSIDSQMTPEEKEREIVLIKWRLRPEKKIQKVQSKRKNIVSKILNGLWTSEPSKNTRDKITNHLRDQYIYVAKLIGEIEKYFEKHPDASAKEIISNTIFDEAYARITKEQWKAFYDTIEEVCTLQKVIESHREVIENNPTHFVCDTFWIDRSTMIGRIHLEIGVGIVQIYTETEEDYLVLVKDPLIAEGSAWVALWEAKKWMHFNIMKTANTDNREESHSTTLHEYRHQQNKKTMAEHVFSRLNEEKWPWVKFIARWKDEIIAQFKWGDRSVEQILSTMTQDEWLYDYYFQEERLKKIRVSNRLMKEIYDVLGSDIIELFKIDTKKKIFLEHDFYEALRNVYVIFDHFKHFGYNDDEIKILWWLIDEQVKNLESMAIPTNNSVDWEKHKTFMHLYIGQADTIIQKYWDESFNLLAVTPIEQWKIL